MQLLLLFIIYVILFYSIYKVMFWFKARRKKNDLTKQMEVYLLNKSFKVDIKKVGMKKILNAVALSNAIIFSLVLVTTILISNLLIRLLVMFILLIPLTYLVYYMVGRILNKKGKN